MQNRSKFTVIALILLGAAASGVAFLSWFSIPEPVLVTTDSAPLAEAQLHESATPALAAELGQLVNTETAQAESAILGDPISRARERVTKKPFGLEIIPGHSPVPNDRFSGFHVGVDFEIFAEEQDADVEIMAVCDGPLILKGFAKGYGGMAMQSCEVQGEKISVIYGHLKEESITVDWNEQMTTGQVFAILGQGYSTETDGVRKHLHLGMRVDSTEDMRGYIKDPVELENWRDILDYIKS